MKGTRGRFFGNSPSFIDRLLSECSKLALLKGSGRSEGAHQGRRACGGLFASLFARGAQSSYRGGFKMQRIVFSMYPSTLAVVQ
jgi:hypothetical protein